MLLSDRVVPLAQPLRVEVAVEDACIVLSNEEFDLLVVAPTLGVAIEGWYYEMEALFEVSVAVDSGSLSDGARRSRTRLLSLIA